MFFRINFIESEKKLQIRMYYTMSKQDGVRLMVIRKMQGLSQAQVAELLGLERSTISKWETGVTSPRSKILIRLSEIYNCNIADLLFDKQV